MSLRLRLIPALTLAALTLAAPAAVLAPTFDTRKVLGVGAGVSDPRSVVAVDLDEDGRLDLVAGDRNGDNGRVTVLRNTGVAGAVSFGAPLGGPFATGVVGAGVGPVAAGDVNADGHPDVLAGLATGSVTDEVVVLTGDGRGVLTPDVGGPITTRSNLTGIAVADLDADGDLDALTSHEVGLAGSQMAVLRQTGAGVAFVNSFGAAGTSMAMDVAAGQLDGTSGTDALVVSRNAGSGSAWIATGTGATFTAQLPVVVGPGPAAVRLADVDADGDLDGLVLDGTIDGTTGLISVLRNDGDANLAANSVLVPGLGDGSGLDTGDLNGDGRLDLLVSDQTADRVGVLLGDGVGGFGAPAWLAMGSGARSALVADVNGDAVPDLITADSDADALSVRRGTSTPSPQATGPGDFGSVEVGSTGVPRTVTLTNTGNARLTVTAVSTGGEQADDFLVTQDACSGQVVRSDGLEGCTVNLRFAPSDAGRREGVLRVHLVGGEVYGVPLSGSGEAEPDPQPELEAAAAPAPAADPKPAPADQKVASPAAPTKKQTKPDPLILTLHRKTLSAAAGARLRVDFTLGRHAKLVLRVKRGARTVEILRAAGKKGKGTITWDGRLGAHPAPPGSYRLAAYAVATDGATARASASLKVRR